MDIATSAAVVSTQGAFMVGRTTAVWMIGGLGVLAAPAERDVAAEGIEYSYVQLDVLARDIDIFDDEGTAIEDFDDGTGLSLLGSIELGAVHLFGSYSQSESDVTYASEDVFLLPADTDIKRLDLGIGIHPEITDRMDLVAQLGYTDIDYGDFDFGTGGGLDELDDFLDDTSDGYFADIGLRGQMLPNLEGMIGVRYLDIDEVDNTSLIGSLLFELSPTWGISLSVDAGDEMSTYFLGARWTPNAG
jgi:hypothetical protein